MSQESRGVNRTHVSLPRPAQTPVPRELGAPHRGRAADPVSATPATRRGAPGSPLARAVPQEAAHPRRATPCVH